MAAEPDLKWHELYVPPASVVGDFVMELPSLAFSLPGTVSEVIGGLSEALPHFDNKRERQADMEAGG